MSKDRDLNDVRYDEGLYEDVTNALREGNRRIQGQINGMNLRLDGIDAEQRAQFEARTELGRGMTKAVENLQNATVSRTAGMDLRFGHIEKTIADLRKISENILGMIKALTARVNALEGDAFDTVAIRKRLDKIEAEFFPFFELQKKVAMLEGRVGRLNESGEPRKSTTDDPEPQGDGDPGDNSQAWKGTRTWMHDKISPEDSELLSTLQDLKDFIEPDNPRAFLERVKLRVINQAKVDGEEFLVDIMDDENDDLVISFDLRSILKLAASAKLS